jgi:hypothetical protein
VGVWDAPPPNTWQIHIQQQLDQPGALGYHTDNNNQPVAYVMVTDSTSVTVSHELLEMLGDPFGSRMTTAALPQNVDPSQVGLSAGQRVHYLLELCDPCENASYQTGGVAVSDFLLPSWYRTAPSPCVQYSKTGYCKNPREVADGGYVSFSNDAQEWFQVFNQNGTLSVQDIGKFNKADFGSLREWVDSKAREHRAA